MGVRKSQVNVIFYVDLLRNILADVYSCFPEIPRYEMQRDFVTIESRVDAEGLSFLTKTLPLLGKALDKGLETGTLTIPPGFSHKRKSGVKWNIPTFMSALFSTIFDVSGHLSPWSKGAVGEIRQVCYCFYKLEVPFSDESIRKATQSFKDLDESLPPVKGKLLNNRLFRSAQEFLEDLFRDFDPECIKPRHGPGAVSDRYKGRDKWNVPYYDPDIDCVYPYASYITGGVHAGTLESLYDHNTLPWGSPPPARVVFVPKDSRGPRTISCEPALLQYLQQGISRKMTGLIESHPLTRGRVNFTDQSINQRLAMIGSVTRSFATLDMKDASDRVSWSLVEALFPKKLLPYLRATRSRTTELPDGSIVHLNKYAPMGSALCFPIEALVFYSLALSVVRSKTQLRARDVNSLFIYGDDIICLSEHSCDIISFLELYGLRFNRDKCFVQGFFRESCGVDAYHGVNVTPVRLRCLVKQGRSSRSDCFRLSENAIAFFDHGFWRTAEYLWSSIENGLGYLLPCAPSTFEGICRTSHLLPSLALLNGARVRWNDKLHRHEVRTFTLSRVTVPSPFPDDVYRLLHNLIEGCLDPYDEDVAVLSGSALPKTRWAVI
jgi:hypothetical protein